jgi:hypothetical protein
MKNECPDCGCHPECSCTAKSSDLESRLARAETIIAILQRALGFQIFEDAIGSHRIALTGVKRTQSFNQLISDDEREILEGGK